MRVRLQKSRNRSYKRSCRFSKDNYRETNFSTFRGSEFSGLEDGVNVIAILIHEHGVHVIAVSVLEDGVQVIAVSVLEDGLNVVAVLELKY